MYENINFQPCPQCGLKGIHSCTGSPMKPWTKEEIEKLNNVLGEIFNFKKEVDKEK